MKTKQEKEPVKTKHWPLGPPQGNMSFETMYVPPNKVNKVLVATSHPCMEREGAPARFHEANILDSE